MSKSYSKAVLASYATFTELYNSGKYTNPYQILAEFLLYTVMNCGLYTFQLSEIKGRLYDNCGLEPPLYVIKKALGKADWVSVNNKTYHVDIDSIKENKSFQEYKTRSEASRDTIIDALKEYIAKKFSEEKFDDQKIEKELILYLIDEDGDDRYRQVISEFVLAYKDQREISNQLKTIREGCILYTGLAYNVDDFGSLRHNLTLFLDIEIIFDIAGYNGELYKALATDFLNLVADANKGQQRVILRFFSEVKNEIELYFDRAEAVVAGHGEPVLKPAMKAIVNECKTAADVVYKKASLYRMLKIDHRIIPDDRNTYNRDSDLQFNLEGTILSFPKEFDTTEGLRFCSNINKLRKGELSKEPLSCGYLAITDTKRVIAVSNALIAEKNKNETGEIFCGYASSLSRITNDLWYKLNRGFSSKAFPSNLDCAIKARSVLARYVSQNITDSYKEIISKAKSGELSREDATLRILALREKKCSPDEITEENAEDNLCVTNNHLEELSAKAEKDKRLLAEKDEINKLLYRQIEGLEQQLADQKKETEEEKKRRDVESKQQQNQINNLTNTVAILQARIDSDEEDRRAALDRKKKRKAIRNIVIKIIALLVIAVGLVLACKHFNRSIVTVGGFVFGLISIIPIIISIFRKELKIIHGKINEIETKDADK